MGQEEKILPVHPNSSARRVKVQDSPPSPSQPWSWRDGQLGSSAWRTCGALLPQKVRNTDHLRRPGWLICGTKDGSKKPQDTPKMDNDQAKQTPKAGYHVPSAPNREKNWILVNFLAGTFSAAFLSAPVSLTFSRDLP